MPCKQIVSETKEQPQSSQMAIEQSERAPSWTLYSPLNPDKEIVLSEAK